MKSKLTTVLCIGLIQVLFGIAFPADAAPKQSSGITYNATLLNIPAPSIANGINDAGQIVGQYGGNAANQYGFIYSGGSITNTLSDNAVNTQAIGINNAGQVVGAAAIYATAGASYGFIYNGGNFTNFSAPGVTLGNGGTTLAFGINSAGQIVGYAGGVVSPGGVVGPYEGFIYLGSTFNVLKVPEPGATNTVAEGINSTGEVVGYWQTSTSASGFIYKNGVYTVINVPGSTSTQLRAVNDLGQIVGTYIDASNIVHPFIYENGNYDDITVLLGGKWFWEWELTGE